MYLTTITTTFSAAHFLREYEGRCENLHGHNWKVEVTVRCTELDRAGMGLDFRILKEKTAAVLDLLDHSVVNEQGPFTTLNPSSENLARYVFDELAGVLDEGRVTMHAVKVWESETSRAEYRP
jgi:6-pyruvoyltetrahydropterin/6-carboxytetrahydropterin synthase